MVGVFLAKNFYDLDEIRSISILEVCDTFGVKVNRAKMCSLRSEKTPSCKLYTDNRGGFDHFHDFGDGSHGDVIVFVSRVTGSDWQTALETLAGIYGIEPVNNIEYQNRNELTNAQYAKIGIYGDLATKNLDIDLERFSVESAQKYSDKYRMTVNELRREYPEVYTYKILMGRALPFVSDMRNDYYTELYNHYSLALALNIGDPRKLDERKVEEFSKLQKELDTAEKLLHKAAEGTSVKETLKYRKYNVIEDYEALIDGKISFQVGSLSYHDLKCKAREHDEVLRYRSVPSGDYFKLACGLLNDVHHAAFLKGDSVNLVFLPEQDLVIDNCIDALKVEKQVDSILGSNDLQKLGENMAENVVKTPVEIDR